MTALAFAIVAVLYAAVGHGGASGYLAVMALLEFDPAAMKPTALVLNVAVSLVGTVAFVRAGHFRWRLFGPFAIASVPLAFVGGMVHPDGNWFRLVVAVTLAFAAVRLLLPTSHVTAEREPPLWAVAILGALMGFVSGLIGVGGGIFLTPLLLFFRWASPKEAAAASAPFILVNSVAGLLGNLSSVAHLPEMFPLWLAAAIVGGVIGARWGSRIAQPRHMRTVLAAVLAVAVAKLVIS
jgi:uncharacterized membrane protein YfcA